MTAPVEHLLDALEAAGLPPELRARAFNIAIHWDLAVIEYWEENARGNMTTRTITLDLGHRASGIES